MAILEYTLRNLSTTSLGIGRVGFLNTNSQGTFRVEEDSEDDTLINRLIQNGKVSLVSSSSPREPFAPSFSDAERTALQGMVSKGGVTNIQWEPSGQQRLLGYQEGDVIVTITYLSNSIVISDGTTTVTITLDGSGKPSSINYG